MVLNINHELFFPTAVSLKKDGLVLSYTKSFEETYMKLKDNFDLIIVDKNNLGEELSLFINYCENNDLKIIVINSEDYDKDDILNKIFSYLGR